jgi:predicted alpha-1,6-mannanase (GH76 family)
MYPYKIQIVQTRLPQDHPKRLQNAIRFAQLATQTNFLNNLLMTDEAHFHLNGYVYKQKYIFCTSITCIHSNLQFGCAMDLLREIFGEHLI